MSIRVKCRIVWQMYPKETDKLTVTDYRIFKCEPLQSYDDLILDSNFQFSIKGDLSYLFKDETHELELDLIEKNKWGATYSVKECLSFKSLDKLTRQDSEEILKNMASENNIKTLLDEYPNFINLVLTTDWKETIDTSKLYNIKEGKMSSYVKNLNEKYKYYAVMVKHKDYGLSIADCRTLINAFKDIATIDTILQENPYYVLIDILGRRFTHEKNPNDKKLTIDELICSIREDLIDSDIRTEYMMLEVLTRNEQGEKDKNGFKGGSTKLRATILWDYCKGYDQVLTKRIGDVAKNCDGIYYDEETKNMSKMSTYMQEVKIAEFVKDLCHNNQPLNLDWEKYKIVKDGTLTDEQSQILKGACDNRFIIVDAGAGCGKSASMMAMLKMFDDYKISYRCMTATGKSAKRFQEASGRSCHTIHRDTCGDKIINEQVIVIDEDSLLSIELICMILGSITNPNVRFVCLGDIQQLLNLSLGTPIKDLINSGIVPIYSLTKCFRFGKGGKATVSTKCRNGEFYIEDEDIGKDVIVYGEDKDYTFINHDGSVEQILEVYQNVMKKYRCKPKDIWVLTPYNVREFGCYDLNNNIQTIVNPPIVGEKNMKIKVKNGNTYTEICFRKNDIVMNTVNNYSCISLESYEQLLKNDELSRDDMPKEECMNGMSGRVLDIDDHVMKILFDETILVFSKDEVKNLLLGYVLNHFKAQGSQIAHVILLTLPHHEVLLNKQCLYTGLTRATDTITEIGTIQAIESAVNKNDTNSRDTWLPNLLV